MTPTSRVEQLLPLLAPVSDETLPGLVYMAVSESKQGFGSAGLWGCTASLRLLD